jgi:Inner membrane component of T3SS, cytoplasmic domain/zinc-ribbon domain
MRQRRDDRFGSTGQYSQQRPARGWRRLFAWRMDRHAPARVPWSASDTAASDPDDFYQGRQSGVMPTMQCARCGRPNPDDARFCSNCGAPLARAGQPGPLGQPPAGHPPMGQPPLGQTRPPRPGETTSTLSLNRDEPPDYGDDLYADPASIAQLPVGSAILHVLRGPNAGSTFRLDGDLTTAGRHPDSDIFLDDVTVSRRHAEFYREAGRFTVRDVGSLNGTYVNGSRIEEAELAANDEVQIGKFRLKFLASPDLWGQPIPGRGAQGYA